MAKFCMNCGSPLDEGAAFCENCGARVDAPPQTQPPQPPIQQYEQPRPQYAQPVQPYTPQQPYQPNQPAPPYGAPQPPKKKKGWLIALISVGAAVTVLALVLIIIALVQLSSHHDEPIPTEAGDIAAPSTEAPAADIPDFEKYGIMPNLALHDSFDYPTSYEDPDDLVTTRMTLDSFSRAPITQDMIDFGLENDMQLEGYEVLKVSFVDILPDDAVEKHIKIIHSIFDYYHIEAFADSFERMVDSTDKNYYRYEIEYYGAPRYVYCWIEQIGTYVDNTLEYHDNRTFFVPAGYDGIVTGYKSPWIDTSAYIYENFNNGDYHIFRLIGDEPPAPTEKPTEKPTQAPTQKPTQKPTEKPKSSIDTSSVGDPKIEDFSSWLIKSMDGWIPEGARTLTGGSEINGKWKFLLYYGDVSELGIAEISAGDRAATVKMTSTKIDVGDGLQSISDPTRTYDGALDSGSIGAYSNSGNLTITKFYESGGKQYAFGSYMNPSGETAYVALVRP